MNSAPLLALLIPIAFSVFGGALAWASWDEARRKHR